MKDIDSLIKAFNKKKAASLKEAEAFRQDILKRLDAQIDALYKKKDDLSKSWKKKARSYKIGVWRSIRRTPIIWHIRYLISAPFIYMMIIPALIMHAFAFVYMHICFPLYGIPKVSPKGYFIYDRKKLPYLNWFEKFNCFYCSYFNGLVGYIQEIAGRTERYWCPIKHARRRMVEHSQYAKFIAHDDAEHAREEWAKLRKFK